MVEVEKDDDSERYTDMRDEVNDLDYAWLACAIDGEGSMSLIRSYAYNNSILCYCPIISVTNNNTTFLEECKRIMETERPILPTKGNQREKAVNWKETYHIRVSKQSEIKVILNLILPFLVIKNRQAKLLLEWIDIRESLSRGWGGRQKRETEIYEELRELNKKGKC
jgi:hypothetical protein